MPFNPKPEYTISPKLLPVGDFYHYADEFVTRPPYQRKGVWSLKKKQALLDSLFRRYYIPKIVIREVRLNNDKSVSEVVDGQQRIIVVQEFFANKLKLPKSLSDVHADLPEKYHKDLSTEFKRFVDKELQYDADIVKGIDDPRNPKHQKIATEIFWRLQQGESLNFMEIAHAKLSSLSRNLIVKYADDITFNFDKYKPVDENRYKHNFFKIIKHDNNRMQHLQIFARFLLIEKEEGYTDLGNNFITKFVDDHETSDGIGDYSFEDESFAKSALSTMKLFYDIFKDDPILDEANGLKELRSEYVILSFYILLRHFRKNYVPDDDFKKLFRDFLIDGFFERHLNTNNDDNDMLLFKANRQQSPNNLEIRDQILRQLFFEYAKNKNVEIKVKDGNRGFNEAEKIKIYRKNNGLCQECLSEGKSEKEARVSWSEYEADHVVPHSRGGMTEVDNAQVLCRPHNRHKSAKV